MHICAFPDQAVAGVSQRVFLPLSVLLHQRCVFAGGGGGGFNNSIWANALLQILDNLRFRDHNSLLDLQPECL